MESKQYRHYQLLQVEELHRRLMNGEILSDIEIQWLEHRCTQNPSSNSTVFASIDSSHEKGQMVRSALSSSLHSMLECSASDSHATKRGSSWRKSDRSIHSKVVDGWKSSLRHVISSRQYSQVSFHDAYFFLKFFPPLEITSLLLLVDVLEHGRITYGSRENRSVSYFSMMLHLDLLVLDFAYALNEIVVFRFCLFVR